METGLLSGLKRSNLKSCWIHRENYMSLTNNKGLGLEILSIRHLMACSTLYSSRYLFHVILGSVSEQPDDLTNF